MRTRSYSDDLTRSSASGRPDQRCRRRLPATDTWPRTPPPIPAQQPPLTYRSCIRYSAPYVWLSDVFGENISRTKTTSNGTTRFTVGIEWLWGFQTTRENRSSGFRFETESARTNRRGPTAKTALSLYGISRQAAQTVSIFPNHCTSSESKVKSDYTWPLRPFVFALGSADRIFCLLNKRFTLDQG